MAEPIGIGCTFIHCLPFKIDFSFRRFNFFFLEVRVPSIGLYSPSYARVHFEPDLSDSQIDAICSKRIAGNYRHQYYCKCNNTFPVEFFCARGLSGAHFLTPSALMSFIFYLKQIYPVERNSFHLFLKIIFGLKLLYTWIIPQNNINCKYLNLQNKSN